MPLVSKDPDARLDYTMDWSGALASGDTISTSSWVLPSGITLYAQSNTSSATVAWLQGGTAGSVYPVVNRIVTANGVNDDRTIQVVVENH